MKKILKLAIFIFITLPMNIFALENDVAISCNMTVLKNNMETECKIEARDLKFTTTSISGKIKVSDNLTIISSTYDKNQWKILDSNFNITDINLISENKNSESTFTIATFKLKAINRTDEIGEVKFIDVELGDEEYESHKMNVDSLSLKLNYDKANENIKDNPATGDLNIIIPIIGITLLLGYCIFNIMKRKKYE